MSTTVPSPVVVPSSGRRTLLSVLAGVGAAVAGGLLWGIVLGVFHFRLGLVAVAVGAGVGFVMARTATPTRGLAPVAGVLALAGCLLGEMFGDVIDQAKFENVPLGTAVRLTVTNPSLARDIFADHFDAFGVVFWAIGAWAAFSFVRKTVAGLEAQLAAQSAAAASPVASAPVASAPVASAPVASAPVAVTDRPVDPDDPQRDPQA
ncbi:hypothetical protein [Kineosporia sp. A_224]|uniref:hypothetical protein n=1 Tax=Kineosporia sp. A_224 TaxID=1962180 RepID=UPI000B4A6848|nr:hypothetical protein [Kineosporia sp. A_224]